MTGESAGAVWGGVVVAFAAWAFMFRLDRRDIWPRTWMAAAALAVYSIVARMMLGDVRTLVGHISLGEISIGAAVGLIWVLATRLGAALLSRAAPSFANQTLALYRLAAGSGAARVAGPLVAMAVAEELLFRGLVQARAGFAAALVIYAAVQIVEGKWPLILAAALGALVWGGLFAWRNGLVASSIAHATWTVALTLVSPLPPTQCRP